MADARPMMIAASRREVELGSTTTHLLTPPSLVSASFLGQKRFSAHMSMGAVRIWRKAFLPSRFIFMTGRPDDWRMPTSLK